MIALYSADARHSPRVAAALRGSAPVVSTDRWDQFERAIPGAACSIAVVEWLQRSPMLPRLTSLKTRFRLQPIVLVTNKDADNARALRGIPVEEVVWLSEIEEALRSAVRRANASALLQRAGFAIRQAARLPAVLRDCLAYACGADGPVHSVAELATTCGLDRRTLWRHWRAAAGGPARLRLEDVVDWLLLLHAVGRKVPSRSWSDVAAELKVHQHTLARAAARLAGRPLKALAAADQLTLATQFDAQVLAPLLGETGGTSQSAGWTRSLVSQAGHSGSA